MLIQQQTAFSLLEANKGEGMIPNLDAVKPAKICLFIFSSRIKKGQKRG